jgi:DNA-binding HxlR family transcriptional regulator
MLRTKKQEKDICSDCPMAKAANLMGDTCTLLIIRDLLSEPKRFVDIESSLSGVSSRTVTKKLQLLEQKSLIKKDSFGYSLTQKGKALNKIIDSMRTYGEKYL